MTKIDQFIEEAMKYIKEAINTLEEAEEIYDSLFYYNDRNINQLKYPREFALATTALFKKAYNEELPAIENQLNSLAKNIKSRGLQECIPNLQEDCNNIDDSINKYATSVNEHAEQYSKIKSDIRKQPRLPEDILMCYRYINRLCESLKKSSDKLQSGAMRQLVDEVLKQCKEHPDEMSAIPAKLEIPPATDVAESRSEEVTGVMQIEGKI